MSYGLDCELIPQEPISTLNDIIIIVFKKLKLTNTNSFNYTLFDWQSIAARLYDSINELLSDQDLERAIELSNKRKSICIWHMKSSPSHHKRVLSIVATPNGGKLITGGDDGKLKLWPAKIFILFKDFVIFYQNPKLFL